MVSEIYSWYSALLIYDFLRSIPGWKICILKQLNNQLIYNLLINSNHFLTRHPAIMER